MQRKETCVDVQPHLNGSHPNWQFCAETVAAGIYHRIVMRFELVLLALQGISVLRTCLASSAAARS